MKQVILIIVLVFLAIIIYLVALPPRDVTLKDMLKYSPPVVTANRDTEETVLPESPGDAEETASPEIPRNSQETASPESPLIESSKADGVEEAEMTYYIILQSFRNLTLAQQKAEQLEKEFHTKIVILPPTAEGYYRISYGHYSTMEEARSIIQSVKTNVRPDAWIYSLKVGSSSPQN